jgi:transaldolase
MTLSEARKNIVYAVSPKGFSAGMNAMLSEKDPAVIKEIYIDLQSRLICWTLEKAVKKEEIAQAVKACEAFLKDNVPAETLKEVKTEANSIAASNAAYLCKLHDEGRMGFIWGHDLCSGYYWSLRRGARFITSNPAKINVFRKNYPGEWAEIVKNVKAENPGLTPEEMVSHCWVNCVAAIAKELRPIYDASFGKYGFVCIQPNPTKLEDTMAMVDEIRFFEESFRRIFDTFDPNIVYKIPAVPAAREAARILKGDGLRLCITLNFSVFQHDTFGDIIGSGDHGDFLVLMGGIVDDFVKKELVAQGMDEAEATEASHSAAAAILHRSYWNNIKKGISPIIMAGSSRGAWSTAAMLCDDASHPVAITSMAEMIEIYDAEPRSNTDMIHQPLNEKNIEILGKSAVFRAAYETDGLNDGNILSYGPLQFVSDSFINAYYETLKSLK